MNSFIKKLQAQFARDMTSGMLKTAIILVALVLIVLALTVENKWLLAGILAYEVLP